MRLTFEGTKGFALTSYGYCLFMGLYIWKTKRQVKIIKGDRCVGVCLYYIFIGLIW